MQNSSRYQSTQWCWPFSVNTVRQSRLQRGSRLTFERLEAKLLLSFTAVASLGENQNAAWTDFDLDGWVDVVAGGTLYKNNNGNLQTFSGSGFVKVREGIFGDYDNDGWPDFYSHGGTLLHNNEGISFTNKWAKMAELPDLRATFGVVFGDFDGDSFLDIYAGNYEKTFSGYYADYLLMNNAGQSFTLTWTQTNDAVVSLDQHVVSRRLISMKIVIWMSMCQTIAWNRMLFGKMMVKEIFPMSRFHTVPRQATVTRSDPP